MQRISEFKLHSNGDIDNNGQAVILIASSRENYLKPEKLRYLTLIRDLISLFLKKHYSSDSFIEYIKENTKNYEWNAYTHGWEAANEAMKQLITTSVDQTKLKHFQLAHLLLVQSTIVRQYQVESSKVNSDDTIEFNEIREICKEVGEYIFSSENYKPKGSVRKFPTIEFDFPSKGAFLFKKDLLTIILAEIFHNFKNNSILIPDNELFCSVSLSSRYGKHFLKIENSYFLDEIGDMEAKLQEKKDAESGMDEVAHGTEMIKIIYKTIYNNEDYRKEIAVSEKSLYYQTMLPIFDVKS